VLVHHDLHLCFIRGLSNLVAYEASRKLTLLSKTPRQGDDAGDDDGGPGEMRVIPAMEQESPPYPHVA
jgi:hypothetical protein